MKKINLGGDEVRRTVFFFFLLLFISFSIPLSSYADEEQIYIVSFTSDVNEETLSSSGATVIQTIKNAPIAIIKANEATALTLQKMKEVTAVEQNEKVKTSAQQLNWGIQPIKIPQAWETGYTGKGVKIAIIDTGSGPHDDLEIVQRMSFVKSEPSATDFNGHGTHIAGIIGAKDNHFGTKGIAPDAELYALKVFDKSGIGYTHDVIQAIDWAIENGMDIINMSLTSESNLSSYETLIDRAYHNGILIVGAAGNKTETDVSIDNVQYPARYKNVIAVSSVDWDYKKGYFSSIGPAVEVSAPGVSIFSTHANNNYEYLQGTSMATAFVTGHLALLKEAYPQLTNEQLRKKMIDDSLDLGPKGRDSVFGYGFIQASAYTLPLYEYPASKNPVVLLTFPVKAITGQATETVHTTIMAHFKNGQTKDVSDFAKWTFEQPEVATSRGGRIDLHREGESILRVSYGGQSASIPVTVMASEEPSTPAPFPFKDVVEDSWATEDILKVYGKRIITGYEDRTFKPAQPIQRQHAAAMIARTLNLERKTPFTPFLDVHMDSSYYYEIVATQRATIFSGDQQKFGPTQFLTRAHMAKVIVEAFDLPMTKTAHPFPDVEKNHWANEYIATLYESGITTGSNGLYQPTEFVTRQQFAAFISRALDVQPAE